MTGYNGIGNAVLYLALVTFIFGCTTLRPLTMGDRQALRSQLEAGDEVKITRKDGSELSFAIDSMTDEGIYGDGTLVAWSDIQEMEVRQFSTGKTVGLVAAIILLAYNALAVAAGDYGPY